MFTSILFATIALIMATVMCFNEADPHEFIFKLCMGIVMSSVFMGMLVTAFTNHADYLLTGMIGGMSLSIPIGIIGMIWEVYQSKSEK